MCGLAAIFCYHPAAAPVDRIELLHIREAMLRRGPDGEGLWVSDNQRIGLAHRRLAIIDLSASGAQPMATADGAARIVFNGEIYNYRELRQRLETRGYRFQSRSDTEVLLHLYQEYGRDMVQHLRGMYAFAIWDERQRGLFLARDPFGIKPLYIADNGGTVRVASQVKALLKGNAIDTAPEPAGHVGFYLWGHVPEPYTLYKDIRALPAGTSLWIDADGKRQSQKFFSITGELARADATRPSITRDEMRERLRAALLDSVNHHLVADVPVGVFLSAGLDSTTLTALAKEIFSSAAGEGGVRGANVLHTITLGFKEFMGTPSDEVPLAERSAQRYGCVQHTHWVTRNEFQAEYQELLEAMDQPTIDGVNTYFVSKAAKAAGLKVALSGLGGDELFGGYSSFRQLPKLVKALSPFSHIPALGKGFRYLTAPLLKHFTSPKYAGLLEYGGSYGGAYLLRRGMCMPWELPRLLDGDMVRAGWAELQTMTCLEQTTRGIDNAYLKVAALESTWYLRNQLLRDTDWASMAHSLEVRAPFVDIALFRAVTQLVRMGRAPDKHDMALAPSISLPGDILERRKTGFSVPVREWSKALLADAGGRVERGLNSWAYTVSRYSGISAISRHVDDACLAGIDPFRGTLADLDSDPQRSHRLQRTGLLASEVCTKGGIQSFMLRVAGVIGSQAADRFTAAGFCVSLNDSTAALCAHPAMPAGMRVWGANRSKVGLIAHSLRKMPPTGVLFVGHVGLAPLARLLKLIGRVRTYYVILHGIEAWRKFSFLERLALQGATGTIATTSYTARECARCNNLTLDRFHVIPLCADERSIVSSSGFALRGEFKLLCVARQDVSERYKGFEQMFKALSLLGNGVPGAHLNLIGTGNDQRHLREIADELGVRQQVTFWGELPDEDLAAAYEDCDVFVMPSRKEGFGIVFLEAMRRGKPCIGGSHCGTPDVIEHGRSGFLVEHGDASGLADQIRTLAQNPQLRKEMGTAARLLVENKFNKKKFETAYAGLFRS